MEERLSIIKRGAMQLTSAISRKRNEISAGINFDSGAKGNVLVSFFIYGDNKDSVFIYGNDAEYEIKAKINHCLFLLGESPMFDTMQKNGNGFEQLNLFEIEEI